MSVKSLPAIARFCRLANHGRAFHRSSALQEARAAPQEEADTGRLPPVFRTSQTDPGLHAEQHLGLHYTLSPGDLKTTFPHGFPLRFQKQIRTFGEACIMVRRPGLELVGYLKAANYSHPVVRYVIYSEKGCGKTLTLCNAVQYCAKRDWLILHIPNAYLWVKHCKELMPSTYNEARFDQPLEASTWLKNFRITNERFLAQLKTQQRYTWSKREATEEGRPLGEVVDQGITRVKNASDVVGVLFKELKSQCLPDTYQMLVAVDGVNALWGPTTMKKEDKSQVLSSELTLIHNLRKLLSNDWAGGAVVTTLTQTGALGASQLSHLPHELLRKDGFDALDPFIPIQVTKYSQKEFESCYQYYIDRKWIQHEKALTEEGKQELIFLSNYNPGAFDRICGPL
ncbi:small ribosomal subunit protein mS29 isoform X1 [Mobula birostris]|uniref:small ribosomal subunit protein mS29 isoform X1 n=1 Tax=Mobula birostris TaxID=1983395 RepID=UPI003B282789